MAGTKLLYTSTIYVLHYVLYNSEVQYCSNSNQQNVKVAQNEQYALCMYYYIFSNQSLRKISK